MSLRGIFAFIGTLALASACHPPPQIPPEQASQMALQEQLRREWLADEPPPEAYLDPIDQERARLIEKPCGKADSDHGCRLLSPGAAEMNPLVRDAPCAIYTSDEVRSRPVDQCYRMTGPQHFKGVWIDAFEGSRFYPDWTRPPAVSAINFDAPDAREKMRREARNSIWLNIAHVNLPHGFAHGGRDGRAVMVEFIGRQTLYPGHYGHLGMSGHEIVVDRLIEARELP